MSLMKAVYNGFLWAFTCLVTGIVLSIFTMFDTGAIGRCAPAPMTPTQAFIHHAFYLFGYICLLAGLFLFAYSAINFRRKVSSLRANVKEAQNYQTRDSLKVDYRGLICFDKDCHCIFCRAQSQNRREARVTFSQGGFLAMARAVSGGSLGNVIGTIIGGTFAGTIGTFIGMSVFQAGRRSSKLSKSAIGVVVNYAVCDQCRPKMKDSTLLWLILTLFGWLVVISALTFIFSKNENSPWYLVAFCPMLVLLPFWAAYYLLERLGDGVRIKCDENTITVETPTSRVVNRLTTEAEYGL